MIGQVFKNIWNSITGFFKDIVDWFKNSPVGKFFGLDDGAEEREQKAAMEGTGKYQTLAGEGDIDISNDAELSSRDSKDPIAPFFSKSLNTIIQPDSPEYMNIKKRDFNTSERYVGSDGRLVEVVNEPKSLLSKRQVVGDYMEDGSDTSDALKFLQNEAMINEKPNIINIQNNATSNTAQSQSSNISGFIHHEPDESFKFVKQGNTGSYDF